MRIAFAVVVASCSVLAAVTACGNGDDDDTSATDGGGTDASTGGSDATSSGSDGGGGGGGGGDSGSTGGGTPTKIATGQMNAGGIATNGSVVVWTTNNAAVTGGNLTGIGDIMAMPTSGSGAPTAIATSVDNGAMVAVDSTSAYWFGASNNDIYKLPLTGGTATTLESMLPDGIYEMAIDSNNFYWANQGNAIHYVPLAGGTQVNLGILDDAGFESAYDTQGIAVSTGGVFAATGHSILKIPDIGGSYTTVATDQNPTCIVADATNVYWGNFGSGGIAKVQVGGGAVTVLAQLSLQEVPGFMAVDATNLYWIEIGGSLKKVPIAGGTAVTLAPAPEGVGGLALDSTTIYWTDSANGDVYALAK